MNPLVKILCYLTVVILAACLLSPPVYWFCQWAIHHGWLSGLEGFPFHRYFSRIIQIAALVLAWPCVRWLHVRSVRELGLEKNPHWKRDLGIGFAIAIIPLAILAAIYLSTDVYHIKKQIGWGNAWRIVGAAAIVPLMEEFFFRGVLLGLALRVTSRLNAILGVSFAFALIHFLKPEKTEIASVTWTTGFQQAATFLSAFTHPSAFLFAGFISLFIAALLLGYSTVVTRSLWLAIGMHAAWIFGQQFLNLVARFRIKPPEALFPWIGPNQVSGTVPIGICAVAALGVTALLLYRYLHAKKPSAP